jgi:hypothetical protein
MVLVGAASKEDFRKKKRPPHAERDSSSPRYPHVFLHSRRSPTRFTSRPATAIFLITTLLQAITHFSVTPNDQTDPGCPQCIIDGGTGAMASPAGGGTLYYIDNSNNLYSLNPVNLDTDPTSISPQAIEIGPLGSAFADFDAEPNIGTEFALGFGPDGNLYAYQNSLGRVYRINTSTGAATLFGGVPPQTPTAGALISGDGNLYSFVGNEMFSINLTRRSRNQTGKSVTMPGWASSC